MSYTYDENVLASIREADRQRNTRTLVIALIIIIIVVVVAVLLYIVFKIRASAATAASNSSSGSTTTAGCTSSAQCSGSTPVCKTSTGKCVQCTANSNCSGTTPVCKTSTNTCVQCNVVSDCPACNACINNTCQASTPTAPTITDAHYTGTDTLFVSWTATPTATNYLIDFLDPINPTPKCVNSMCEITVSGSITSYTVPPGNAACAPGPGSHVFVTAVTPCGNVVSAGFLLNGQGC